MADDLTVDNGALTDFIVVTDEETATGKHMQVFKLAISVDGVRTLVPATVANGLAVDVTRLSALIAGTNRIGGTYDTGGQIIDENGTVRTVQRAFENATLSGNNEVVAAQGSGIRIRVLSVKVVTATALTIKFQSATTDISPGESLPANGGFVMPRNVDGWFQTAANEALNINLSGAGTVGCTVTYIQAT